MNQFRLIALISVGLLGTLMSGTSFAWGQNGHAQIGDAAEAQLDEQTQTHLAQLLALENAPSLGAVASWADQLRASESQEYSTARWHFVNLPRLPACQYRADRDCANGECIISAISRHWMVLADPQQTPEMRLRALKFLVHFVGDLHQPLHVGYADDRGGNLFQVQLNGEGSNLHAVWDRHLADQIQLGPQSTPVEAPSIEINSENIESSVIAWAQQSCQLIEQISIYPQLRQIDQAYTERHLVTAKAQMQLAADRLAILLRAADRQASAGN